MEGEIIEGLNGVAQAFNSMVFYHEFFAWFFLVPILGNLWNLLTYKNFVTLNRKIWYMMPLSFFLFSVAFFSGISMLFFNAASFSASVFLMFLFSFLVLFGEIFRRKMLAKAMRTNELAMKKYIKFCVVLYLAELAFFAVIMGLAHL